MESGRALIDSGSLSGKKRCVCVGSRLESGTCDVSSVFGSCLLRQVLAMSKPAQPPMGECCGSALISGKPLSEAAQRRLRRRRRAAAVFALAETCGGGTFARSDSLGAAVPVESLRCGSVGFQNSFTGTFVPGEFSGSGGCWMPIGGSQSVCCGCGGGGFSDVWHHVAVALRYLAAAWESTGGDEGQFVHQKAWTEETALFAGSEAAVQFGDFPGTVEAAGVEAKSALFGRDASPLAGVFGCGGLSLATNVMHRPESTAGWFGIPPLSSRRSSIVMRSSSRMRSLR